MIGSRARHSLAQFLELQEPVVSIVMFSKYGAQHLSLSPGQLLYGLLNIVRGLDDRALMLALAEIVATQGDLRSRVNPKYRFDERLHDLTQCLLLDGYAVQKAKLVQVDPSIEDAAPLEDDLIIALLNSAMFYLWGMGCIRYVHKTWTAAAARAKAEGKPTPLDV